MIDDLVILPKHNNLAFILSGNILNPMSMYGAPSPWRRELQGKGWNLKGHGSHLLIFNKKNLQVYEAGKGEIEVSLGFDDVIVDATFI